MAKFMLSLHDEPFALLSGEAKDRGIKVQELIRAVIIPEWVRVNMNETGNVNGNENGNRKVAVDGRHVNLNARELPAALADRYQGLVPTKTGNGQSTSPVSHRAKSLFR